MSLPGCVVAGEGLVPEPPDQAEEGHHQRLGQTLLLHVRVFGHLQHPASLGAGPPPRGPRPASQLPLRASASPGKRLPAEQPGRRLLHLPRGQQQHPAQLPARGDFRAVAAIAGRHPALAAAGRPPAALPLLLHAAAGGRSPRTDVRLRLRLLSFRAVHASGQERGRHGRQEDSFLSQVSVSEDAPGCDVGGLCGGDLSL